MESNEGPAGTETAPGGDPLPGDPILAHLQRDIERTRARLPVPLADLAELAWNYAWSWQPGAQSLFREVDSALWAASRHNPRRLLDQVPRTRLTELAADAAFLRRRDEVLTAFRALQDAPLDPAAERLRQERAGRPIAYFCSEYAIHEGLPIYSGGLGVLAGDHVKSASDLGLPFVAVGLRYQQGYFRQELDATGWQSEFYEDTPFGEVSLGLLCDPDGCPLTVELPLRERCVRLQLWGARVGRVSLLLLDSLRDDNDPTDRWITGHLYGGGIPTRLVQEAVLGIGGVRALRRLGYAPAVVHLNEGHAAFACLELLREQLDAGLAWEDAVRATREQVVFTTHTPVPAGHDRYGDDLLHATLGTYLDTVRERGAPVGRERLLGMGEDPGGSASTRFCMTPLALRLSRAANAVSRLHGEVSREMWRRLWPGRPAADVPITSVTNGVHLATWMAPLLRELLAGYLGPNWEARQADPGVWAAVETIPDHELWEVHCHLKARLVEWTRERTRARRLRLGATAAELQEYAEHLDEGALTIGFARRVASYKRLHLLLQDRERALRFLGNTERPVQIILSGKAHPSDQEGKRLIQHLFQVRADPWVARRAAYLEDYDLATARAMVQGVDVWLNLPRHPMEASGTSGMKAAMNGVLHCSIHDGWWAEGYDGRNGWVVDDGEHPPDPAMEDVGDAGALYSTLEQEIVPIYYRRDEQGIPHEWVARMKAAIRTIGPRFNTQRMVRQYVERLYLP